MSSDVYSARLSRNLVRSSASTYKDNVDRRTGAGIPSRGAERDLSVFRFSAFPDFNLEHRAVCSLRSRASGDDRPRFARPIVRFLAGALRPAFLTLRPL